MVFGFLKFLFICVEVVLVFNLLILVHELGHFLAARWRGLVVEKFAIWFGKPIWSKTINGVEYRLGSIPAGGFVALPQMAAMETLEGGGEHKDLPRVKALDKIIVALAGPVFSFGLALCFAVIVWVIGRPVSEPELSTVVGYVVKDGPAAKAGIEVGDKILEVNGHPVTRFSPAGNARESIIWNIARSESPIIPIIIEREGKIQTLQVEPVAPERKGLGRRNLKQILIFPAQTPRVAQIAPHSPAADAGLKSQDLVIAANGQKLLSMAALAELLKKTGIQPVSLTIQRPGEEKALEITVTPRVPEGETDPRIGIYWDDRGVTTIAHPNPWEQIKGSVATMWETLSAIVSRGSGISIEHLSGPVGIMRLYYMLFESPDGWRQVLWFSVVINVNLALLNLLPFPVLDGGHIVIALIEGIRRRPLNPRLLEPIMNGCALLIIGYMLYITFYDVLDLPWKQQEPKVEMKFSPAPEPARSP